MKFEAFSGKSEPFWRMAVLLKAGRKHETNPGEGMVGQRKSWRTVELPAPLGRRKTGDGDDDGDDGTDGQVRGWVALQSQAVACFQPRKIDAKGKFFLKNLLL